jgi:hypothetical protein
MNEDGYTRAILATNLRRLIEADLREGERISVRAWAMARELDVRLIDRPTKGEHAVTLDKLEEISAACGLRPWQLLYEGLDPHALPDEPITADERAMLQRLRSLFNK